MTEPTASTYIVDGMSYGHCRTAVQESVNAVEGVDRADVDLESGHLEVHGGRIEDAAIEAAVREAGYRVAEKR
jgi:copper chaperone